jgi:hypothetical protein
VLTMTPRVSWLCSGALSGNVAQAVNNARLRSLARDRGGIRNPSCIPDVLNRTELSEFVLK